MFTGIIEEIGKIKSVKRGSKSVVLEVEARKVLTDTRIGDSIATNGVCLTVVGKGNDGFSADVMPETMNRSNLGLLKPGDPVNLERALCLNSRLGGHLVAGHVDGTGKIVSKQQDENAIWLTVGCSRNPSLYCRKGLCGYRWGEPDDRLCRRAGFQSVRHSAYSGRDDAGEKGDRRCGEFRKRYDCQICRETDGTRKTEGGTDLGFPGGQWLLSRLE